MNMIESGEYNYRQDDFTLVSLNALIFFGNHKVTVLEVPPPCMTHPPKHLKKTAETWSTSRSVTPRSAQPHLIPSLRDCYSPRTPTKRGKSEEKLHCTFKVHIHFFHWFTGRRTVSLCGCAIYWASCDRVVWAISLLNIRFLEGQIFIIWKIRVSVSVRCEMRWIIS